MIEFPPLDVLPTGGDLIFTGGDLSVANLLNAYAKGYFPMPVDDEIGWFSPERRAILRPGKLQVSKSLLKSSKKFGHSVNQRFEEVMLACADPARPHGWIDSQVVAAYSELHKLGKALSFEVLDGEELVGGLYGVQIESLFAGESMFHESTDASKVALGHLVEYLDNNFGDYLLDAQWLTPHLASLGFVEVSRAEYGELLNKYVG